MHPTIVIGHRNPDSDSICSAWAYARLKARCEPEGAFLAARCGSLNPQTRFIFDHLELTPPPFIRDVYPQISDITEPELKLVTTSTPLLEVMELIERHKINQLPVVDERLRYQGMVGIFEIAQFYMRAGSARPRYAFHSENFGRVLEGFYLKSGRPSSFTAAVVVGAMPHGHFLEQVTGLKEENLVLVVGMRRELIAYAVQHQFPALILTGFGEQEEIDIDFGDFAGTVFISRQDTAETLRKLVLSIPVSELMNRNLPIVKHTDYTEEVRETMLKNDYRGLPVVDDEGRLEAVVTRSDLLKKRAKKLILMDHNELSQAVEGAETAEIREIVDHHRLGTPKTRFPVTFFAKPVGSTCTLVYQLYRINRIEIGRPTAALLLAGLLSDTIILKSPTTTAEDHEAAQELKRLSGLDPEEFGRLIFSAAGSLAERDPQKVIEADFKLYQEYGLKVGIGQVEIISLSELEESFEALLEALQTTSAKKGLDWGMLLVTDIISGHSRLLSLGPEKGERGLAFRRLAEHLFDLPGILSRKKQLLPEILRVLEEINQ